MARRALDWLLGLRQSEKQARALTASTAQEGRVDAERKAHAADEARRAEADRLRDGRADQAELEAARTLRAGHVALASAWREEREERLRASEKALVQAQAAVVEASRAEESAREELARAHAATDAVEERISTMRSREKVTSERLEEDAMADTWVSGVARRGLPKSGGGGA